LTEPVAGQFEKIASGLYLEGLAIDTQRGIAWYSDVIGGGVHGFMPDGRTTSFNTDRMWTGGLLINEDGAVLSTGAGGIMWNEPRSGKSGWLLDTIDGKPINGVNEMIPDGAGGIYFGTVDIEMIAQGATPRPVALYRLTADRDVIKLVDGVGFANGLMLSADGKTFYCNNTFSCTYVFDVRADRTLANQRTLIEKEDVDGMALDAEGNLWITGFRSSQLTRVRPDGAKLAPIETPAGAITQIRFGGADLRDIYINAVPADGGDGLKEGVLPTDKRSFLYRGRSKVPGAPITPTRFKLN
jgi:sugar lactone lactonase YvrE